MARENETMTMMEEEAEGQNNCLSMYIDNCSVESHRLYLARRTALEMLRDRGYGISLVDIDQTLPEFRAKYGQNPDLDQLNISSVLLGDPSKKILVVFCGAAPIKKPVLRDISTQYGNENWSRMILVLQSNMTTQSREIMRHLFPFKVETFQVGKKELSQLPFKKHRLCSFSPLVWRFGEKGTKVFLRKKDDCHLKESRRKRVTGGRSLKRKEIESDEDSSQTFITELLINITKHALMPNHERLSAEEKQKLLKKYNIEDTQLPRMLETDAIAWYYGYEKGTFLKITYEGELTKTHVTYRCVM